MYAQERIYSSVFSPRMATASPQCLLRM